MGYFTPKSKLQGQVTGNELMAKGAVSWSIGKMIFVMASFFASGVVYGYVAGIFFTGIPIVKPLISVEVWNNPGLKKKYSKVQAKKQPYPYTKERGISYFILITRGLY